MFRWSLIAAVAIGVLWFSQGVGLPIERSQPVDEKSQPLHALVLGPVWQSEERVITSYLTTVQFKFPISNPSDRTVEIAEVGGKCACTIAKLPVKVLEPGATTEVSGEFRVDGKHRSVHVDIPVRYSVENKHETAAIRITVSVRPRIEPSVERVVLTDDGERRQSTVRVRQFRLPSEAGFEEAVFTVRGDPLTATIAGKWSEEVLEEGFFFREAALSLRAATEAGGSLLLLSAKGDKAQMGVERIPVFWKARLPYQVSRRSVILRQGEPGTETVSLDSSQGAMTLAKLSVPPDLTVAVEPTRPTAEKFSLAISVKSFPSRATIRTISMSGVTGKSTARETISVLLLPSPSVVHTKGNPNARIQH